jgi:hypothetical protein
MGGTLLLRVRDTVGGLGWQATGLRTTITISRGPCYRGHRKIAGYRARSRSCRNLTDLCCGCLNGKSRSAFRECAAAHSPILLASELVQTQHGLNSRPLLADVVANVENRTTRKISRKLIFGLLCGYALFSSTTENQCILRGKGTARTGDGGTRADTIQNLEVHELVD